MADVCAKCGCFVEITDGGVEMQLTNGGRQLCYHPDCPHSGKALPENEWGDDDPRAPWDRVHKLTGKPIPKPDAPETVSPTNPEILKAGQEVFGASHDGAVERDLADAQETEDRCAVCNEPGYTSDGNTCNRAKSSAHLHYGGPWLTKDCTLNPNRLDKATPPETVPDGLVDSLCEIIGSQVHAKMSVLRAAFWREKVEYILKIIAASGHVLVPKDDPRLSPGTVPVEREVKITDEAVTAAKGACYQLSDGLSSVEDEQWQFVLKAAFAATLSASLGDGE